MDSDVSIAIGTVVLLFQKEGLQPDAFHKLAVNLLLVQAWYRDFSYHFSLNIVTWSLSVEMFFYVVFIFIRRLQDNYLYLLTATFYIGIVLYTLSFHGKWNLDIHWKLYINPIARLPEFLVGMSVYRLYKSGKLPRLLIPKFNFIIFLTAMIATAAIAGSQFNMGDSFTDPYTYSIIPIPFVAMMLISLLDESSNSYMHNKLLVLLGEASFALYLIHRTVIHFFSMHFGNWIFTNGFYATLAVSLIVIISVLLSVIFYKFIEIPCTKYLRNLLLDRFTKSV